MTAHPARTGRRPVLALAAVAATVVTTGVLGPAVMPDAVAAGAPGQIVFDHGDDLWAADADGSHAHVLVTAARVGVDHLGEPALAPDGDVLLFTGWSDANRTTSPHDVDFWGLDHMRTFELHDGQVTALSPAPQAVAAPRETDDLAPEPAPDGRSYVYAHLSCTEEVTVSDGYGDPVDWGRVCSSQLRRAPLPGGSARSTAFATLCDDDVLSLPSGPVPDPAAPARVAYAGCRTPDPTDPYGAPSQGALVLSGPARQGEVEVGLTGQARGFDDPSFSPDGQHLVAYDEGGEVDTLTPTGGVDVQSIPAGLYVYDDLSRTTAGRLVLSAPATGTDALGVPTYETFTYPRFLGSGLLGFVAGGSVYTVPASCSGCTLADATLVHDGGQRSTTQASSLAWSSRTVAPARPVATTPPRRTQHLRLTAPHHQRSRAVRTHGVRLRATCRTACRLSVVLTVPARLARASRLITHHRYRVLRSRHRTRVKVGHATAHLHAGRRTTVHVRLAKRARRALAHRHRWTVRVVATPHPGGHAAAHHRAVHVRR